MPKDQAAKAEGTIGDRIPYRLNLSTTMGLRNPLSFDEPKLCVLHLAVVSCGGSWNLCLSIPNSPPENIPE